MNQLITVVSGLPRSGTSLMMMMLEAGGLPLLTDGQRVADDDNPRGYYEFEPVKGLAQDASWIPQARGKAVKVISALLEHLPESETYRVLFMRREMKEILASQRAMLARRGHPTDLAGEAHIAQLSHRHVEEVLQRLRAQPNAALLEVSYNDLIARPLPGARAVARFLGAGLDAERMASAVDPSLYRQRRSTV
jgi:hypothetical protein